MVYDNTLSSFVNIISTPKGGTHVQGFERAITKAFNDALRATKTLKNNEADVIKDDVLEGLTSVVTVRMSEPQFEGQTKEVLGTAAATKIVAAVVAEEMKKFFRYDKAN
jgi:DNA gyrase subunit B